MVSSSSVEGRELLSCWKPGKGSAPLAGCLWRTRVPSTPTASGGGDASPGGCPERLQLAWVHLQGIGRRLRRSVVPACSAVMSHKSLELSAAECFAEREPRTISLRI